MNENPPYLMLRPVLLLCLALFVSMAAFGAAQAAAEPIVWGSPGNGNGQFDTPMDVAVASGPEGDVYAVDRGNFRIQRFSADGEYLGQWGSPGTGDGQLSAGVVAVAVAPDGKVFVLDDRGSGSGFRVQRFDADGTFELGWGSAEGSALGQFDEPRDIAVGPGGRVYVAEAGNHRVQSFDPDGSDPAAWGSPGNGGGNFADPVGIAVDQDSGDVYVADGGATPQIQVFSASGAFLREWGATGNGDGQLAAHGLIAIAIDDGDLYTRESLEWGDRFQRFDLDGDFISRQYWNVYTGAHGLAVSGSHLYAPDTGDGTVHVWDLSRPTSSMLGPIAEVGVEQPVTFQSTSWVPLGEIVKHEWDLDGDGVYEQDSGASPEARHVYSQVGTYTARLRVTSDRGGTDVDTREVQVVVWPQPGPVGVTINNGARYTRDPDVTVSVRWPIFSTFLRISDDGGFHSSTTLPVASTFQWRLDSGGPQRRPRTIYVRFGRFGFEDATPYTDDIYLDLVKPTVQVIEVPVEGGPNRLELNAHDKVSGVAGMQLMRKGKKQGWRRFSSSLRLRGSAKGLRVRVRDRAGNRSAWVRVRPG